MNKIDAKKQFLNGMKKKLGDKMGDKYGGEKVQAMKKVIVASPTSEGLNLGLNKAQEMLRSKLGLGIPGQIEKADPNKLDMSHNEGLEKKQSRDSELQPLLEGSPAEEKLESPEEAQSELHSAEHEKANIFQKVKDLHPEDMNKVIDLMHSLLAKKK